MRTYFFGALTLAQTRGRIRAPLGPRFLCSAASSSELTLRNVTKSNFEPALDELRRRVGEANFVSIDLEMTGVTSAPWREAFEFDRSDVQYLKIKDSAEKFAVVQFGVCPFRWDPQGHCFVAHPYNFYIFPRQDVPLDGFGNDFLCQTSSLEFLAKYQFDFNTCIYEGISYLSRSQELEALRQLNVTYQNKFADSSPSMRESVDTQLVRMADILFVERMKNNISEWFVGLRVGDRVSGSLNKTIQKFETTFFGMRPSMVLSGLSTSQLRLTKLVLEKHFKDLCYYVHGIAGTSVAQPLVVYTDSIADRDLLMREIEACKREKSELKIKGAIGFRHVIDLLSSEKKLIVGHNCFLDLAHVYSKFFGPLPSTSEEFASALQVYFPHIIDTKLLLNSDYALFRIVGKAGTSLSKAYSFLCSHAALIGTDNGLGVKPCVKVEVQVDDQRFSNWNSGLKHEAGYDAFMTGSIFARACLHLGIDHRMHSMDLLQNEKLQKYMNHLYLSWANGDIIDLKTGKGIAVSSSFCNNFKLRYPKVDFSKMIIMWGEPSRLRIKDVRDCLSKVFGIGSVTSAYHLDETATLVQFSREELVDKFFELKDSLQRENSPISVVHPLSRIFDGDTVYAATYETYKEICSSPISEVFFSDQAEAAGINCKTEPVLAMRKSSDISSASTTIRLYRSKQKRTHESSLDDDDSQSGFTLKSVELEDSLQKLEAL